MATAIIDWDFVPGSLSTLVEYKLSGDTTWTTPTSPANPTATNTYSLEITANTFYDVRLTTNGIRCTPLSTTFTIYAAEGTTTTTSTTTSTTSTTTTTTTTVFGVVEADNTSDDIVVTDITVNGATITLTSGSLPFSSGNSVIGTTPHLGTQTVTVAFTSTIVNQHIRVTGSNGTPQCQTTAGGPDTFIFVNVEVDTITPVLIDIGAGVC